MNVTDRPRAFASREKGIILICNCVPAEPASRDFLILNLLGFHRLKMRCRVDNALYLFILLEVIYVLLVFLVFDGCICSQPINPLLHNLDGLSLTHRGAGILSKFDLFHSELDSAHL